VTPRHEVIVGGNSLRLKNDFLGIASITLIHCDGGPVLVDTGGYISRLGLIKALKERDLEPADIKQVFLTHLHFDHSHNIDLFRGSKVLVSRTEWDYAAHPHEKDILMPWGIHAELEGNHDLELVEGEGSLGGGVDFFRAPGHTPGSYALEFQSADQGLVIVAGDALKYAKEAILRRCDMAFDTTEAGTATIQKMLDRADRIVPGHYPELIRQPDGAFAWTEAASFDLLIR